MTMSANPQYGDVVGKAQRTLCLLPARRLRMLVISSDTYPPFRVDLTVLFGKELAARGHQVDLILQSERACTVPYVTEWEGGQVWVGATDTGTSLFSRIRKHILSIAHDMKLFSRLRNGHYDVIEIKDKFISGIMAIIAARLYRKRFIYWLSYPFPEDYLSRAHDGTARYPFLYVIRGNAFKLLLYRVLLPAAHHVFVQSDQMRCDIAAHGVPLSKMTAVPMGIDPQSFDATYDGVRRLLPAGQPCFLYLGTLIKVRRLDFLVRVLAELRKSMPQVKLYIVGRGDDPSDEQLLLDEARKFGVLDALVMVGQLPRAEALHYVREADVCVSPFYPTQILNSTSPTKLVEYMAMAKPVVANDHPEQKSVLEQSGAGYCVHWDEAEFAAAVLKLLQDPSAAREMGARGRRYVLEHRSYVKIADRVEAELQKAVEQSVTP